MTIQGSTLIQIQDRINKGVLPHSYLNILFLGILKHLTTNISVEDYIKYYYAFYTCIPITKVNLIHYTH